MPALNENEGLCLENEAGYVMMPSYDMLPIEVRAKLQYTTNNLCSACLFKFMSRVKLPSLARTLTKHQQNTLKLMGAVDLMDKAATKAWEYKHEVQGKRR